jgi:hypothetical protein
MKTVRCCGPHRAAAMVAALTMTMLVAAVAVLALLPTHARAQDRAPDRTQDRARAGAPTGAPTGASDRADIDRTRIIGNRELPKVLYIVPWKKPLPGELSPRPAGSVLDEALAPVDRDVFRRQVQYDAQIKPLATSAATPAAAAAAK